MGENPPEVRIGHLRILDHLVLGMSAHRQGEKSLIHSDLVPVPMNSWDQVCDGLRQGDLQGAFIPLPLAMDMHASGFPLECLMLAHRAGSVIIKNRKITQISSLKGKTVLVPSELSIHYMLLHRLLQSSGLRFGAEPESDVAMQVAPPFLMPQILELDEDFDIGGFMVSEPFGALAVDQGLGKRLCTSASLWKDHPCCGVVLEKDFSREFPRAAEELICHFLESAQMLDDIGKKMPEPWETGWMPDFLGQEASVIWPSFHESGICFTPSKLIPDPGIIGMIQTYMMEVMGVLCGKIDLDDFLNPSWALNGVSEANFEN